MAEGGQRLQSGTWCQREARSVSLHLPPPNMAPVSPVSVAMVEGSCWGVTDSEGVGPLGW